MLELGTRQISASTMPRPRQIYATAVLALSGSAGGATAFSPCPWAGSTNTAPAQTFRRVYRGKSRTASALKSGTGDASEFVDDIAKAKELIEQTKKKIERRTKAAAEAAGGGKPLNLDSAVNAQEDKGSGREGASLESGATQVGDASAEGDGEAVPFFAQVGMSKEEVKRRRETFTKSQDDDSGLITTDGDKMASISEEEAWERRSILEVFENELKETGEESEAQKRTSRDIAMAMMNLRKQMWNPDYDYIFDKKNWTIGDN